MKVIITSVFALCLGFSSFSYADGLDRGVYELNRGQFKAAIVEFAPLVEANYPPAQRQMGLMHLNGWGFPKSASKAFEYFTLAADKGDIDAMFELSFLYSTGKGTKKDLKKAFQLMEKAAHKELPGAQFNVGVMYANGEGVSKNNLTASRWYEKAANQNYALAQFNLALMYFEGKGVGKSIKKSYVWNILAAQNGYAKAVKSRDMDEYRLNAKDVEIARTEARALYSKIIARVEKKEKIRNERYRRFIQ